jgi:hypothetical protein
VSGLFDLAIPVRRKCFISYYAGDSVAVTNFVQTFSDVFIPKVIGVSESDDFINSNDSDYVMGRIRAKYLEDSTVTICIIGTCTHSRRYVDWEIKSSLRQGLLYTPNGLLGILLPGMTSGHLPPRFKANWDNDESRCYALYRAYPSSAQQLRNWIEQAFARRSTHANFITNSSDMHRYNRQCITCGVTH